MSFSKRQLDSRRRRRAGRSSVQGASALSALLRMVPDAIAADVKETIAEGTRLIHAAAVAELESSSHPYATGELRRKLTYKISKDGLRGRVGSWGRKRARHIHLVEFGTHPHEIKMPDGRVIDHPGAAAKPFLFPAYRANRNTVIALIRTAVLRAIELTRSGGHPVLAGEAADAAVATVTDQEAMRLVGDDQ